MDLRAAVLDSLEAAGCDCEKQRAVLYATTTEPVIPDLCPKARPITRDGLYQQAVFLAERSTAGLLRGTLEEERALTVQRWLDGAGPSLEAAALAAMQGHIARFREDPSDAAEQRALLAAREFGDVGDSLGRINGDKRKAVVALLTRAGTGRYDEIAAGRDALLWERAWFAATLMGELCAYTVFCTPRAGASPRFVVIPAQLCMYNHPKW